MKPVILPAQHQFTQRYLELYGILGRDLEEQHIELRNKLGSMALFHVRSFG
jgi:hypothetical protein